MNKITPFDIAEYLDSEEAIAEYLTQVLQEGDSEEFLLAVGHIAKARGMKEIAQKTGLGRESLYKAFAKGSHPRFETVMKVVKALGVRIEAHAEV